MKATKDLTQGNIYKNMMLYALPLILSSIISQAYSTVDSVIAGKFISEHALGAISSTGSFDFLFFALFNGFAAGFSIYISHLFGEKQYATIKRDSVGMIAFVAAVSLLFSIGVVLFCEPILDYLKVDPLLREDAKTYFIIITLGYVIRAVNLFFSSTLAALGITSFSFYVSLFSALLNIGGNLLLVLLFDMGVAGLAISTLISCIVATVIYVTTLRKAFSEMKCEKLSYRFSFRCVTRSLRYSLPSAIQQLVFHGVGFVITPSINALGADATTGYAVANRIYWLGVQALWGTTNAFACYTGQCVGAHDVKKIRRGLRVGFLLACAVIFPFVLAFVVFAKPFVSIFFPEGYVGAAYQYAVRYAVIFLPLVYIQVIEHVFHSYMRCLGSVTTVLLITIFGSAVRIAATLLLIPSMQLDGVFLGQVISWAADSLISTFIFTFFFRSESHIERAIERTYKKVKLH